MIFTALVAITTERNDMNHDVLAPARRQSWVTHRIVDRILGLMRDGLPTDEVIECLRSVGVSNGRIIDLINGNYRERQL